MYVCVYIDVFILSIKNFPFKKINDLTIEYFLNLYFKNKNQRKQQTSRQLYKI